MGAYIKEDIIMRINNNVMALNTHRQYGISNSGLAKSSEKLSSGYKINRAGDDAAGLAISEKMRAQIRGLNMASKNSQDAISLVQTAEGALQETHNILQRMRELAVQAGSDTNENSVDRVALNEEFSQLIKEIDDTASKTKFNDMGLIDGTFAATDLTIQTGANKDDTLGIKIAKMDATELQVKNVSIAANKGVDARAAIETVNNAINTVSTERSKLGALQNRLNHKINNLDTSAENLTAAESRIRDIDMAKEMSNYTKQNILIQASTSMLAQANNSPQNVLKLLG